MKKFIICLFLIGAINVGHSQIVKEIFLEPVELKAKVVNPEYLQVVQKDLISPTVLKFQKIIAGYDIKKLADYDKNSMYEVVFKTTNGNIYTYYNGDGKIIWSKGKYHSVRLPVEILKKVVIANGGWRITDNKYVTTYKESTQTAKSFYSISITNGTKNKKININL